MDKQQERSRMDEENAPDKGTDLTRNQNRQQAGEANEGRNVSNDPTRSDEGARGRNEAGSHQEGEYDKSGRNPEPKEDAD